MSQTVLAIIPARGGSKGIARKNLARVLGRPLISYTLECARKSTLLTDTLVSSEDEEILEVAKASGLPVAPRPDSHATDSAQVDPLLIHTVTEFEERENKKVDIVVLLYPTAPLRIPSDIDDCIRQITEEGMDSALTLYEDHCYLWKCEDGLASPTNYDPANRKPRQLEAWNQWVENKAVYTMRRDLLIDTGCRLGGRIGYVEMPKARSIDIDTPDDLVILESALQQLKLA